MVSGADVRVALEAGLWEALVGSGERAAMRSSCGDARAMADMLHDTAVLPVGPDTWSMAATIAAYHRRLGAAVRSLHVRYGAGAGSTPSDDDSLGEDDQSSIEDGASVDSAAGREEEEAHEDGKVISSVQFMEAYSAALGPALPATHCSVDVPDGWRLPTPFAAVLLQRVVPGVERLDMALGSYGNLARLLQALEPCTRLRALRLLPTQHGPTNTERQPQHGNVTDFHGAWAPFMLDVLCKLTRLHTLSGPWTIEHAELQRLCDALPDLTTLGFLQLHLPEDGPYACISRQLHTLAAWEDDPGAHAPGIFNISAMAAALPAVQQLKGVSLNIDLNTPDEAPVVRDVVQRFAACAHEWVLDIWPDFGAQRVAQGLPAGCLAPLQHLDLTIGAPASSASGVAAAALGRLLSAAPNLTTVMLRMDEPQCDGWGCADMIAIMPPLQHAAHLHTLRLRALNDDQSSEQQAAALEGVVRCLAQPGAEGEGAHCRALQRVLLKNAPLDALDACRRALARDGIAVAVDTFAE